MWRRVSTVRPEQNTARWVPLRPEVQREQRLQYGAPCGHLACPEERGKQQQEAEFFKTVGAGLTAF